ncbi:cation diffusion facilitator family transporter [Oculatella sp. FACHB-28]|uniref:cation diffusion facilitator family transporter n=1 Tax=Cyanophyceae TaxID=3028117 RepID=UPI0016895AE0|nr:MULTISPECIES: cation diffusion facilitator family transporter [Cyanophyceae]MBD2057652.1 cation diffusion facilitator family transporter [Oculatella sp. FACHB-28]MBD2070372.1 cation diffusion facilitator family transporter [Leptolyngbya sp. FACHB-671]
MSEARNRRRASYQVLFATLWLTLLVLAVKLWAGWATRSLSLLAESLHTLIDSFSIVLSLSAIASSYRTSGREIWTHDRRETAGVLLLASFLGFSGFSLLVLSVQQLDVVTQGLESQFPVEISMPLIQLLVVVVAINLCMVWFQRYEARLLENQALQINANHVLKDAWLTVLVCVGLVGVWRGYVWLDPLLAIALVLMSIRSYWRMLNWQLPWLVRQVAIAPEVLSQIARQVEGVTHCEKIRSKGLVGRQVLVEMSLALHPEFMSVARSIAERVEAAIRERYGAVKVVIYIEGDRSKPDSGAESLRFRNISSRRSDPDLN